MEAKEGVLVPETLQFTMQGRVNFIITPEMMFLEKRQHKKP
jgi:hypothetical protein